ncbi:hypothetical protein ACLX1H_000797 [Fusarium chlamydosporum]
MDDAWESEFSTSRHVHNRRSRKSTSHAPNISHVFGSYQLQCVKANHISQCLPVDSGPAHQSPKKKNKPKRHSGPRLTIQRFTADEHGLVGTIHLPGVLDADIHMSGSRKKLQEIVDAEYASGEDESESDEDANTGRNCHDESESIAADNSVDLTQPSDISVHNCFAETSEVTAEEDRQQSRFDKFEKNTFRQPKFWLFWRGNVLAAQGNIAPTTAVALSDTSSDGTHSGMGYVVFSSNRYDKFKGTISCDFLGWKDVAISGRKQ